MWEIADYENESYGCLNLECKEELGHGFSLTFLLILSFLTKLTLTSVLSVGLAAHARRWPTYSASKIY